MEKINSDYQTFDFGDDGCAFCSGKDTEERSLEIVIRKNDGVSIVIEDPLFCEHGIATAISITPEVALALAAWLAEKAKP